MKPALLVISMILLSTAGALPQTSNPIDLSGSWTYVRLDSKIFENGLEQIGMRDSLPDCDIKLSIKQNGGELKIQTDASCKNNGQVSRTSDVSTYFLDGRGEVNTSSSGQPRESITKWDGSELVISNIRKTAGSKSEVVAVTRLKLSKKGNKLTIFKGGPDLGKTSPYFINPGLAITVGGGYMELAYRLVK